jgi:hypothetical protein
MRVRYARALLLILLSIRQINRHSKKNNPLGGIIKQIELGDQRPLSTALFVRISAGPLFLRNPSLPWRVAGERHQCDLLHVPA